MNKIKFLSCQIFLSAFCFLLLTSFCPIKIYDLFGPSISIPSLEYLSPPEKYYTPNPKDPHGNWIVYEGYYEPTQNRIWALDDSDVIFSPTNDWFQPLACWPQGGAMTTTGHYNLYWNETAAEGVTFECVKAFKYYPTSGVPASGHFTLDLSVKQARFSVIPPNADAPVVHWKPAETGNMLRAVHYPNDALILYLVQGGVFQGLEFNECEVNIKVPSGNTCEAETVDGIMRYQVTGKNGFDYLVYAPPTLTLNWSNGALISNGSYKGYLNVVCIPSNQLASVIDLLDSHARAIVVKAEGNFSANREDTFDYSFAYSCEDLLGLGQSPDPLILLMDHQVNKAKLVSNVSPTNLSLLCLKGNLKAYAGSAFEFKLPSAYHALSTDALPTPGITQKQALALIDNGVLDAGIDAATASPAPVLSIPYNKWVYQKALTLAYAQEVIAISGEQNKWGCKLDALHQSLIQGLNNLWKGSATFPERLDGKTIQEPTGIRLDQNWGTVVFFPDSYGSSINLNDYIVQYGYPLYALVLLDQYEEKAGIQARYLDQDSLVKPYKNRDLANLLAADIGQSGGDNFVNHRNLDFYEGHSWLSGLEKSLDGQNTESESEALLGSMSVVAWLEQIGADSELIQIAKNRWALETSAYHSYCQVDPKMSPYLPVASEFVTGHLVASMIWQNKITAETYWGSEWDRIIAADFMPASANLMDNYLGKALEEDPIVSKEYVDAIGDYISKNWETFDTTNPIQSVLIPLVARSAVDDPSAPLGLPESVQEKINDVTSGKLKFDEGTNVLLLAVIAMYAENMLD